MAYCNLTQLRARFDQRVLNQLSNDAGSSSANEANQTTALDDATATIKMAALQGRIYSVDQLDALYAADDAALIRLCAQLAMQFMVRRRAMGIPAFLAQEVREANELLEQLRRGERVFNVEANRAADTPAIVKLTATQQNNLGSLTDSSFFPDSSTRTVDG